MTGLPVNIYVSSKDSVHDRHGPHIKVQNTYADWFDKNSLTIELLFEVKNGRLFNF